MQGSGNNYKSYGFEHNEKEEAYRGRGVAVLFVVLLRKVKKI